jgi:RNA 2',3'-cyclic 3'-phosphodiesterase
LHFAIRRLECHEVLVLDDVHDMFYLKMYLRASKSGQLFLAVLPDAGTSAEIYRIATILKRAHRLRGQLTARDRLHVTLFSLSGLPDRALEDTCEAVAEVCAQRFGVSFDRTVSFRGRPGSRPFVLTGDAGLASLKAFRCELLASMMRRGLRLLAKRNYTPHVTLLFDDRVIDENPVGPIRWTVGNIVLVHSMQGHTHLTKWPLQI